MGPLTGVRAGTGLLPQARADAAASAGPGAWNDEFVFENALRLAEIMVRHEGDADPGALRILKVCGNSMEPEMRDGDRLIDGSNHLAEVIQGVTFKDGIKQIQHAT